MALINAVDNGDVDEVKKLIEEGYDVNERTDDKFGYTPLIRASQQGFLNVVKYLIEEGRADVTQRDLFGQSCLYRAAGENQLSTVKYLAEKEPSLIADSVWSACHSGHDEVTSYLLSLGADVEQKGFFEATPLIAASQEGHLSTVNLLHEKGKAEVNAKDIKGRTSFYLAAQYNNVHVMDYLLKNGANINETDNKNASPLYTACRYGLKESIIFLVKRNADVEIAFNGLTPLMKVCQDGALDLAKILVEQGSARIMQTNGNKTALDLAKDGNHQEVVDYLESLLSLDIQSMKKSMLEDPYTPLWYACRDGHLLKVQIIMEHFDSSVIEKKSPDGTSPLTIAFFKDHTNILNFFKLNYQLEVRLRDSTNLPNEETFLTEFSKRFPVFNENVEKQFSNPFPLSHALNLSELKKFILGDLCPFEDYWKQPQAVAYISDLTTSSCQDGCDRYVIFMSIQ